MNMQSNAVSGSLDAPREAAAAVPATGLFYWSVRRELYEHRSIYLAPLAAAGVFLFGFLISLTHMPAHMRATFALDPVKQRAAIEQPYMMVAGLMMLTAMLVGAFYCIEALHGERRDRSILFWKSLPVSDFTTVLSKISIPVIVLQLLAFAAAFAVQLIVLLLTIAILLGSGMSVATMWAQLPFFQMSAMLLYHLVILHGLFHAPFYAWLLMVSSWARRAPFLWAVLPPLVLGIAEKIAFNTSYFSNMLLYHLAGGAWNPFAENGGSMVGMLGHFQPGRLLSTPELWTGLAATALFLAAAVRLRRNQGPI